MKRKIEIDTSDDFSNSLLAGQDVLFYGIIKDLGKRILIIQPRGAKPLEIVNVAIVFQDQITETADRDIIHISVDDGFVRIQTADNLLKIVPANHHQRVKYNFVSSVDGVKMSEVINLFRLPTA